MKASFLKRKVHEKVHTLKIHDQWTKPKIFHGGENFDLSKDWYIYYSYRNPETGLLERQTNIKRANRFKNKGKRLEILKVYRNALEELLEEGFSPYQSDQEVIQNTIDHVIDLAMKNKRETWSETNYNVMISRVNVFKEFLKKKRLLNRPPDLITKKVVNEFLDEILHRTSPANRNNYRSGLSPLFSFMMIRDLIEENPFLKIPKLNTKPKGRKVYSVKLKKSVIDWMKQNDPLLLQFIQIFTFGMIRPVEAVRLQVKDMNLAEGYFYVNSKQKTKKKKIISKLLADILPDLSEASPDHFLITKDGVSDWNINETGRREFFTRRFHVMRDVLKFDPELKMYNFRHTIISEIYSKLVEEHGERRSVQLLMQITGHSSEAALNHYLQKMDAHLPSDFSKYVD